MKNEIQASDAVREIFQSMSEVIIIVIAISRDDLAKMAGTAAESVIRMLSDFKDEGLIEAEGTKIKILQPAKLEKVIRWNVAL